MSENRGIFSLEEFYDLQVSGETTNVFEVFRYVNEVATASAFGYLAGGKSSGGDRTSVDRIDYGNDTATTSPKGPVVNGGNIAGTGNQSFGYTAGNTSTCNRIDYASDTATASQKGTLSSARTYISAVGNKNFGYWCGGTLSKTSTVDRLDYSNDTAATTPKGPLSITILASAATGNSDFGYIGGLRPGESRTLRIDYSNDSAVTTEKGALLGSGYMVSATGNSDFGYWSGGPAHGSRVGRLDYSSDSTNMVFRGNVTSPKNIKRSATGSGSFGYITGGDPSPQVTIIDRIDYSNDTSIAAKGNLSLGKYYHAGVSAQENGLATLPIPATRTETVPAGGPAYGFFAGGGSASPSALALSSVERIDFSNDTAAPTAAGNLADKQHFNVAVGNQSYGYNCGGKGGPSVGAYPGTRVQRIDYGNDSATAVFKGDLTVRRQSAAATGSNSYGYIIGGFNSDVPGAISTVDRIDYADDTATALVKGPLPTAKNNTMSTGNQSYGYSAGGEPAPAPAYRMTSVDRIDYASDTSTAAPKGNMHRWGGKGAATGNANYGWFSLGESPSQSTYVTRIDYGNDTATSSPKGPLNVAKKNLGATGNGDYGYWSSGAPQPINTKVSRVDYSNDTATAVDKGPMTAGRYALGGLSSQAYGLPSPTSQTVDKGADGYQVPSTGPLGPAYGYTVGGLSKSLYQRVDYSNDTATASNQAHTSNPSGLSLSVGNNTHAYTWVSGGQGQFSSIVERYNYSDDTTNSTAKGNFPGEKSYLAGAVGNASYGYFMGGRNPANSDTSDVLRVDYSNDTAAAAPKGPLTSARYHNDGGVGNQSYGYMGGDGLVSGSDIDRIDYSNDTATAVQKGNLSVNGGVKAATGNASYGYWGGGYPLKSTVTRLDYSNDSANTVDKGPLTVATIQLGAFGDTSYGYWTGGFPGPLSTVSRLDFSDDTTTAVAKGPLVQTVREHGGNSSRGNAMAGAPSTVFIPRIRWVDSAAEAPAGTAAPGHAYWGGGGPAGGGKTIVDRLDFSNDSAAMAPKGSLSQSRKQLTAVGSPSYVYMMGGYNNGASPGYELSYIDRIDYASDTSTATPKGLLAEGTYYAGATGTASYGYNGGGRASSGVISCTVQRIDYSNDTATASPKGYLTIRRRNFAGCVGNTSYGYWSGGQNNASTWISTTERVDFSNDTAAATVKGPVDGPVRGNADGTGNANYGYYAGGYYPDSPAPAHRYSIVSRIDFSSDTGTIPTKAALSDSLSAMGAAGNASYGYWGAGADPSGLKTSVDRVDFSNDTSTPTVVTAYLSDSRAQAGAASGLMYGLPQTASAAIAAPVQPPFPYPQQLSAPFGYWGGGKLYTNNDEDSSTIDRIDFANDTATAVVKGPLTAVRYIRGATGNASYGYWGAGGPGTLSNVDRVDYSNDTATASARGNLDRGANNCDATGNASYGYWGGGWGPSPKSFVSRVDFSNDSATAAPKGNLTYSQYGAGAAGNQSYGYFAGGENTNVSHVCKIDYSNDTAAATAVGNLSTPKAWSAAASNSDYVYIAGSVEPSPLVFKSTIDRIDFSNDTPTTSPKGSLSTVRGFISGTASPAYGYVGGGQEAGGPGTPVSNMRSTIDRIDFANDTATAVAKGPLSVARRIAGAAGNAMNGLPN